MKEIKLVGKERFGSKAFVRKAEIGKWFKFSLINNETIGYGKIVSISEDGYAEVEKYFELPSYRPYAARKWFDELPLAIR